MPIPGSRVRVGGSGFTVFHWSDGTNNDSVIAFAREVRTQGVTPVAPAQVIQPLNAAQPIEIITPGAHTNGVLTLVLTDLYNYAVWQRLASLTNAQDIVDIMRTIAAMNEGVKISKYINPPAGVSNQGNNQGQYVETFFDCVITEVADNETINIESMNIEKEITVWYTYSRKNWINRGNRKYHLVY